MRKDTSASCASVVTGPVGRRRAAASAALAVAVLAYALAFQGSRGIWEPDEGRYTVIATQMLRSGDFIVPAFNHEVVHFAKPPVTYWAIAAGIAAVGWNEWGARLANALAFAATLLVVYRLGRRMLPGGRAWLAPLVYGTFLLPYVAANIVTTDTMLTLWEAAAVLGFTAWWERREGPWCRLPLLAMWAAFGVAFLTKGPPGMLPLLGIAAFVTLAAGWRELGRMVCLPGVAAFALVGLGWYAVVALIEPGLMTYFVRDEVARRVGTGIHNRYAEWYGPLRVYLPVLLAGTLPWTHLLVARATALPRTLLARRWWRATAASDPWAVLLACWVLLPLAVFSLSRSRLELYILPLFVPIAIVVARLMAERPITRRMLAFAVVWALGMVALRWVAAVHESDRDSRAMARELLAAVSPPPREVVFYETKPVWGLSLYLDCQVERIRSVANPDAPPDGTSQEALFTELVEHEPRRLVVAPFARRDEVAAAMARAGLPYREIATLGGRVLVAAGAELGPALPVIP